MSEPVQPDIVRIADAGVLRPLQVAALALVLMVLAGGSFLLSATQTALPVDGAIAWQEQTPLRAVVQLLCLDYRFPTDYAGDVKGYVLGLGAGLAALALAVGVFAGARSSDEESGGEVASAASVKRVGRGMAGTAHHVHLAPLSAAQLLFGFYVIWSFASYRWSIAPDLSLGASVLLAIQLIWSFAIGNSLTPRAARIATRLLIVIGAVSALVAVWYFYGRNPNLRAKFPFGNPTFLAAAMIPTLLLPIAALCTRVVPSSQPSVRWRIPAIAGLVAVVALCLWTLHLTGSRGPMVGLVFAVLALGFFALRGWRKAVPIVLALLIAILGWGYMAQQATGQSGRAQTLRVRSYAWTYAWRMFTEDPVRGFGQAGFALVGDAHAVDDVVHDPIVLRARIAHAHNEWLEVLADLGSVGIILLAAALCLTFRAGMIALRRLPTVAARWTLIGLMSALVGLIVSEAFGVGLRTPDLPVWFFTVLGLIWAMSAEPACGIVRKLSATRNRRIATGIIGGVIGVAVLAVTQQDFAAARSGFESAEAVGTDDFDEQIRHAEAALDRLNPQRALLNLYRLSEAHLRAAQFLQARARDRERRADQIEPRNPRLLALAQHDYRESDLHCDEGSRWLKELLLRSPGYIHHGVLEYRLNLTRAGNLDARSDAKKQNALMETAAQAIGRELRRQPIEPSIAAEYVRVMMSLGTAGSDAPHLIDILARPLRHNTLPAAYLDVLSAILADRAFSRSFEAVIARSIDALSNRVAGTRVVASVEQWLPEKLRLAAAARFMQRDFSGAKAVLEVATTACDELASTAPIGAAGCYAELARCRFYADPLNPNPAISASKHASELASESLEGRTLRLGVEARTIDYLLAAGDEESARVALRKTGHAGVSEEAVMSEMGVRYARLVESLLTRPETGASAGELPKELGMRLRQWVARAIELNPADPLARLQAADFALRDHNAEETVRQLRSALQAGLPVGAARRLLHDALDAMPGSEALLSLDDALRSGPPVDSRSGEGTVDRSAQP